MATAFVERCLAYCSNGGSTALVTPQNWLFLGSYKTLRETMLRQVTWNVVSKLGPAAFDDMNWWAANTLLSIHTNLPHGYGHQLMGLDASREKGAANKAKLLVKSQVKMRDQFAQLSNPDARISLEETGDAQLLSKLAKSHKGITTNDDPMFLRKFWEFDLEPYGWERHQSIVEENLHYGGREHVLFYENGNLFIAQE